MDWLVQIFGEAQQYLFEGVVQPFLFHAGMANLLEDGYAATGWLLVGLIEIVIMMGIIVPLQHWKPVEAVVDRQAIRVDIIYTLIHRLGLFRLGLFFTIDPMWDAVMGKLHVWGFPVFHLDDIWPGVTDNAWVSLILYLLVFDLVEYWIHRGQHGYTWWWKLHAVHHSQRQMTVWSDDRNHLLDDVIHDAIIVLVAQLIGVAPGQFVAIVALTQLSQSFQHANVRIWFGKLGERLWISPRFHRRHHAIGIGHEPLAPVRNKKVHGNNFGVLLPWWDMAFGTANFDLRYDPTGIRDQVQPNAQGQLRDYGRGFWAQQWRAVLRLMGRA
ncbi:fatty acid hydroxylase family protein [Comamonas testosteroni]|uniref:Fatty acid hydroxylase family protein n=1 Tax=Comamonas testosteroni TaxID=285 RepID=A0A373FEF4_COMTE|nr:sterol desaturase family protein [Comamonas testosteroni]RGE42367.1 fatty acid hydroxylase family protein [Comamonas testosteroni]